MIKYTRFFITFFLAVTAFAAHAQSTATSSSPYSRYGIGDLDPQSMSPNIGMGGIGVATNRISLYNSINVINPASYGALSITTIDIGLYTNFITLSQTGSPNQKNVNFKLSHVAFGIPVTKRSALSFGLLPYSERGYSYTQSVKGSGVNKADTNTTNYTYSGDGALSKAYIGYGFGIGKHLLIGGNASYIFGNLKDLASTEIPNLAGTLNTGIEQSNAIGGLNYDYGIQYSFDFDKNTRHFILGYSASTGSKLNSQSSFMVTQYTDDASGNQQVPLDTVTNTQNPKSKIKLPRINRFGISFQNDGKFLIGADYTMGNWSDLTIGGVNQGLQNSKTFNIGASFTPNINSIHSYLATVDYRLGAIYDETYMNINNTSIKKYAATFGLGLPIRSVDGLSFYKVNFSAEIGKRGSLVNGLVKENYVNLHLGFVLNDRWFRKYKFD